MTEQEQQEAIAKECGWEFRPECGPLDLPWWHRPTKRRASCEGLPDYLHDLNAMHEAIVALCKKKRLRCFCNSGLDGTWECILTESERPNCIPCDGDHYGAGDTLCEAMKEAFLRTVGKWKD